MSYMRKQFSEADKVRNDITHTLKKYPQGLTSSELMNHLGVKNYEALRNRLYYLRDRGIVSTTSTSEKDHSYRYVLKEDEPYQTPVTKYLISINYGNYYKKKESKVPEILRSLEKHYKGAKIADIIKDMGFTKADYSRVDWAISQHAEGLIETMNPEERFRKNRIFRVIGSEEEGCIEYYKGKRYISELYEKYERGKVLLDSDGTMGYEEWVHINRLIDDIEENREHTPKDNNLKISFMKGEDLVFRLILTNDGYHIVEDYKTRDITIDDVKSKLFKIREEIV